MASIIVDGIKMPWVRRCSCGRKPEVSTCYDGYNPGMGPYLIRCNHGNTSKDARWSFSRSWTKSRAVRHWNRMMRGEPAFTGPDVVYWPA